MEKADVEILEDLCKQYEETRKEVISKFKEETLKRQEISYNAENEQLLQTQNHLKVLNTQDEIFNSRQIQIQKLTDSLNNAVMLNDLEKVKLISEQIKALSLNKE
ncbi:hypothetical protein [Lysinibacillus boronitolerans]|uniref:hypothetical protein n=1 Tax=Lysinibacillus boronitolerans TaxID=309788 RepID=UPI002897315F|nr:hypothetical protein [Bacillus mobilis]